MFYQNPPRRAPRPVAPGRLEYHRAIGERARHDFANVVETQCHRFDQLEHLCGPIKSVMAQMTDKTGTTFTTLAVALEFANGAVGSLIGSHDSSYACPRTHLLEINGTKGRLLIEDTVRRYSLQAVGNETAEVWQAEYFNDDDREFRRASPHSPVIVPRSTTSRRTIRRST